jgi:hypothetical protein
MKKKQVIRYHDAFDTLCCDPKGYYRIVKRKIPEGTIFGLINNPHFEGDKIDTLYENGRGFLPYRKKMRFLKLNRKQSWWDYNRIMIEGYNHDKYKLVFIQNSHYFALKEIIKEITHSDFQFLYEYIAPYYLLLESHTKSDIMCRIRRYEKDFLGYKDQDIELTYNKFLNQYERDNHLELQNLKVNLGNDQLFIVFQYHLPLYTPKKLREILAIIESNKSLNPTRANLIKSEIEKLLPKHKLKSKLNILL